jgi:hypothetical protein
MARGHVLNSIVNLSVVQPSQYFQKTMLAAITKKRRITNVKSIRNLAPSKTQRRHGHHRFVIDVLHVCTFTSSHYTA